MDPKTCKDLKEFSLTEINAIFLKRMKEAVNEYQIELNSGETVKKAVITVPQYYWMFTNIHNPFILSVIEAANLAGIEIIDIIEKTHADLLYYLSDQKYSEMIKPDMKIAIFDIRGGVWVCKMYEISEYEGRKYGSCFIESYSLLDQDERYCGRTIDDLIVKELEKSIPEELRNEVKVSTLEAARRIKHNLSSEEKIEFDLSEIDSSLNKITEFTRRWLEGKLRVHFNVRKLRYRKCPKYSLPTERKHRRQVLLQSYVRLPFNDVDIVFLVGGTFRIPFLQKKIKEIFPKAEVVIDDKLESVTVSGAVIHALQIHNGEVEPYIKFGEQESNESSDNVEQDQDEEGTSGSNINLDNTITITHDQNAATSASGVNHPKKSGRTRKLGPDPFEPIPFKKFLQP